MKKSDLEELLFKYGHHRDCPGPECYCGWEKVRRELELTRPDLVAAREAEKARAEAQWRAVEERRERAQLKSLKEKYEKTR